VADALGIDDRDPRVDWRYAQRRGAAKEYAVEIRIEPNGNPQPPNSPKTPIQSASTHTRKAVEMQSNGESLPESAIAGSRIRTELRAWSALGLSVEEIREQYPWLTVEAIEASLADAGHP